MPFTTTASISHYIKYAKNSKTGPNSIPNVAYEVGGSVASSVLASTSLRAQDGYNFFFLLMIVKLCFPLKVKNLVTLLQFTAPLLKLAL